MSGMEQGPAPQARYGTYADGDRQEIAVRVTAADFNGHDWDGSPFSSGPDWLIAAAQDRSLVPHTRGSTDYTQWDVTTLRGVINAGPGDWIIRRERGDLSVVEGADAYVLINLRAPCSTAGEKK